MIKSFKDKRAKAIFEGDHPEKGFPADLIRPARRKLVMLAEAKTLERFAQPAEQPSQGIEARSRRSAFDKNQRSVADLLRLGRR